MVVACLIGVLLLAAGYSFSDQEEDSFWSPVACLFGFVLCAILITCGWWLGLGGRAGWLGYGAVTIGAGVLRARNGGGTGRGIGLDRVTLIACTAVTGLVAAVFYPLFLDGGATYYLPNIGDLPKLISALAACARAMHYPVGNPWVPNELFANQTLFYAPFAAMAGEIQTSTSVVRLSALMGVTAAGFTLLVLGLVMRRLGIPPILSALGVLLASVSGGYVNAMVRPGPSLGFSLVLAKSIGELPWFEDPVTYFLFVPNHVLAMTCVLGAWLEMTRSGVRVSGMIRAGVLLAGAAHMSGAFIPHALAASAFLSVFHISRNEGAPWRERGKQLIPFFGTFAVVALPFIYTASRWAEGHDRLQLRTPFLLDGWMMQLLNVGPVAVLALAGAILAVSMGRVWQSYLTLLAPAFLFLHAVPHMEIALKSAMFLRTLAVPAALLPLVWIWDQRESRGRMAMLVGAGVMLLHATYFSLQLPAYFVRTAYVKRDAATTKLIRAMQSVPWETAIRIAPANPDWAALSGHMVVMDASGLRSGGYLPPGRFEAVAPALADLTTISGGGCPPSVADLKAAGVPMVLAATANGVLRPDAQRLEASGYLWVESSKALLCGEESHTNASLGPQKSAGTSTNLLPLLGDSSKWNRRLMDGTKTPPAISFLKEGLSIQASDLVSGGVDATLSVASGWYMLDLSFTITTAVSGGGKGFGFGFLDAPDSQLWFREPGPATVRRLIQITRPGKKGFGFILGGFGTARGAATVTAAKLERVDIGGTEPRNSIPIPAYNSAAWRPVTYDNAKDLPAVQILGNGFSIESSKPTSSGMGTMLELRQGAYLLSGRITASTPSPGQGIGYGILIEQLGDSILASKEQGTLIGQRIFIVAKAGRYRLVTILGGYGMSSGRFSATDLTLDRIGPSLPGAVSFR